MLSVIACVRERGLLAQLVKITVDMGGLAKDYTKGGQYIQIKVGDSKPAFYALASAPAPDKPVEVIVKNQGDTAEILCGMKPGVLLCHGLAQLMAHVHAHPWGNLHVNI